MFEAEQEVAGEEVSAPTRSTHPFHRMRPSSPRYASSPGPNPRVRDGTRPGHASRSNSIARRVPDSSRPPDRPTRTRDADANLPPPRSLDPQPMTEPEVTAEETAGPVSESVDAPSDEVSFLLRHPVLVNARPSRESAPHAGARAIAAGTPPRWIAPDPRGAWVSIASRESSPGHTPAPRSPRAARARGPIRRLPPARLPRPGETLDRRRRPTD